MIFCAKSLSPLFKTRSTKVLTTNQRSRQNHLMLDTPVRLYILNCFVNDQPCIICPNPSWQVGFAMRLTENWC